MYLLWILGQMLEPQLGSGRFAALYFTALLWGSFGALVVTPDANTVGASGAVFGLMGAAAVELRARGINPFKTDIGLLIIFNLGLSFLLAGISIGGHIGGLIGGALAGMALGYADRHRSRALGYVACAVLSLFAVVGAIAAAGGNGSRLRCAAAPPYRLDLVHRARRLGHEVRVQHVRHQLEAVDQARAGAREVRRRVDRDDPLRADRAQLGRRRAGLLARALGVVAARHGRRRPRGAPPRRSPTWPARSARRRSRARRRRPPAR